MRNSERLYYENQLELQKHDLRKSWKIMKYTHARNVLTVTKRVERSRSIVIIKHKYMLMCSHKIHINLMRCLRNSTARREISQ